MKIKGIRIALPIDALKDDYDLIRSDFVYEIIDDLNAARKSPPLSLIQQMPRLGNFKYISSYRGITSPYRFDLSVVESTIQSQTRKRLKLSKDNTIFHQIELSQRNKRLFKPRLKFPSIKTVVVFEGIYSSNIQAMIDNFEIMQSNLLLSMCLNIFPAYEVFTGTDTGELTEDESLYHPGFLKLLKNYQVDNMASLEFNNSQEIYEFLYGLNEFISCGFTGSLASFDLIQKYIFNESLLPGLRNITDLIKDDPEWDIYAVNSPRLFGLRFYYDDRTYIEMPLDHIYGQPGVVEFINELAEYTDSKRSANSESEENDRHTYEDDDEYEDDED